MVDLVCAETTRSAIHDHEPAGCWRTRLERVARDNWGLYQRHPWLLQLATRRSPLGPNTTAKYEYELRAVDGIGLIDVEMDTVLRLIIGHAQASARRAVETARVAQRSARTDEQWWQANGPLFEKIFDPHRFPVAARVGTSAGRAHNAASSSTGSGHSCRALLGVANSTRPTFQPSRTSAVSSSRRGTGVQRLSGASDPTAGRRGPAW